jgi:glycosyltransferase involved in cell wall biosynthesis
MTGTSVSLIIPVFNERESLRQLYAQIKQLDDDSLRDMEIVFVDDGSSDGSLEILKEIAAGDGRARLLALTRNFGQTIALSAGIKNSTGNLIVTMDADLQNDPKDIPKLLKKLQEGWDVVSGWRKERKEPYFSRVLPSSIANLMISFLTGVRLRDYGCTLKAYRREFLERLSIHGEMHRFLPAYCAWQGAKVSEAEVRDYPRLHGKSNYGLSRVFKVILDLIVLKFVFSYFSKPIYVFGGIAIISFIAGTAINLFVIIRKIFLAGQWLSPLFFVGFVLWAFSIICVLLGLLAEILVRLYFESNENSIYRIKERVN